MTLALARELGRPILSTTAGTPGEDPLIDPHDIVATFRGLSMVLDAGAGGIIPTSVIDLTESPPLVIREGAGPVDAFV